MKGDLQASADLLRALSNPHRLLIVSALAGSEQSVGEMEAALSLRQPGLSQQLAILRKAGLVTTRREAKIVFYSLSKPADSTVRAILGALNAAASPGLEAHPSIRRREPLECGVFAFAGRDMEVSLTELFDRRA